MLDIHLPLMLFVFALFLTLLVLLNSMLFQPLVKFMDERDNSIAKDLEDAKTLGNSSQELNAKADEILANAKNEATQIRQKAIDEAKAIALVRVETKQSELETEYISFKESLKKDKESLKVTLLSQMPLFKESLKATISKF